MHQLNLTFSLRQLSVLACILNNQGNMLLLVLQLHFFPPEYSSIVSSTWNSGLRSTTAKEAHVQWIELFCFASAPLEHFFYTLNIYWPFRLFEMIFLKKNILFCGMTSASFFPSKLSLSFLITVLNLMLWDCSFWQGGIPWSDNDLSFWNFSF